LFICFEEKIIRNIKLNAVFVAIAEHESCHCEKCLKLLYCSGLSWDRWKLWGVPYV